MVCACSHRGNCGGYDLTVAMVVTKVWRVHACSLPQAHAEFWCTPPLPLVGQNDRWRTGGAIKPRTTIALGMTIVVVAILAQSDHSLRRRMQNLRVPHLPWARRDTAATIGSWGHTAQPLAHTYQQHLGRNAVLSASQRAGPSR